MTITKEISAEQFDALGLHEGDSLTLLERHDSTFLVQINKLDEPAVQKRGSAGDWARKYAGIAKPDPGETRDDIRAAHYREKYGLPPE
jgi:hypothetical protein